MYYKTVIIGATFTAAGLASVLGDDCIILERRPQAGYEFISAFKNGENYEKPLKTACGAEFLKKLNVVGIPGNGIISECSGILYSFLNDKNVMLNTEIISVEKENNQFTITTHGVSGFRTYTADRVIDTTVHPYMIKSKSLNMLIAKPDGDCIIKCELNPSDDYITARKKAFDAFFKNYPDSRLILTADCFDCTLSGGFPKEDNDIVYLPSSAFENPAQAFDEGVFYARGGALC